MTHNLIHRLSPMSPGLSTQDPHGCGSSDPQDPHATVETMNHERVITEPLEWSEPPGVGIWYELLAPCTANPRRWALVRTYDRAASAQSAARDLRRRRSHYQPGRWEFASRIRGDRVGLWARYLGSA